jgi:hypothetical protein
VPSQPGSCCHSLGSALLLLVLVLRKLTTTMMFTTLYSLLLLIMLDISHAVDASEILVLYTLLRVFRSTTSYLWRRSRWHNDEPHGCIDGSAHALSSTRREQE